MKKIIAFFSVAAAFSLPLPAQWSAVSTAMAGKLETVVFTSATNGFTSGSFQYIYKTTDGGTTWTSAGSYDAKDLYFFNASNAYSAGVAGTGTMKNTTNGGTSWTTLTPPNSSSMWGTFATSATTCYFIATDKKVHKSVNSGGTWTSVTLPITFSPTDIWFTDANTGFITTQDGIIFKTTNAGSTWVSNYTASGVMLNSVYFINTSVGFACGSNGTILKTVNGGTSWTSLNSGVTTLLYSVRFYDGLNGLAVGLSGTIVHTTDGGTTWTQDVSNTTRALYSISYTANASSAIVVGDSGTVLKNTNIPAGINDHYGANNCSLSHFPNPANNFTTVVLNSTIDQKIALRIFDMNGQLVQQLTGMQILPGENEIRLDLADIAPGIYFLQAESGGILLNQKLVISR